MSSAFHGDGFPDSRLVASKAPAPKPVTDPNAWRTLFDEATYTPPDVSKLDLTAREKRILALAANGLKNEDIAAAAVDGKKLSRSTIADQLKEIYRAIDRALGKQAGRKYRKHSGLVHITASLGILKQPETPEMMRLLTDAHESLQDCEKRVFHAAARHNNIKGICGELNLKQSSVSSYLRDICRKFRVGSHAELVRDWIILKREADRLKALGPAAEETSARNINEAQPEIAAEVVAAPTEPEQPTTTIQQPVRVAAVAPNEQDHQANLTRVFGVREAASNEDWGARLDQAREISAAAAGFTRRGGGKR